MRFDVVTLFPELFEPFLRVALVGKAAQRGAIVVRLHSPRDHAVDKHGSVDDAPYGGGHGMVMRPGPLVEALEALDESAAAAGAPRAHRILLTPQGAPFTQSAARRLAREHAAIALVCGRYEGFDERVRSFVDEELSLGDFVMTGGEVAAMAVIEAVARLRPGVLGNPESTVDESHAAGMLEYPQYTRPPVFRGMPVPAVLLSGDHAKIEAWRRAMAAARTAERRPDLLARRGAGGGDAGGGGGDAPGDGGAPGVGRVAGGREGER
jgi:tRNA (guanine37-N1)-methyltransferase